ncbi:MAG: DNA polymerase III subunit delta' [Chloroflexi bacterium]|nr:DNA polymerase III subunit delta' [Chloroflexota bacterium]
MPWNTIGHEWAVAMLARAARTRPSHAYLITGPAQIGKLTLAQDFARALNCTAGDAPALFGEPAEPPCGVCRACQAIAAGRHPDVHTVKRQADKSEILVDQLRDVQNELALKPYEARWRVAIVEHIDEANASAANAFLKTLEEPAPQVVIVLTAQNPESVLPTIRSRCQQLPLRPLPIGRVEDALVERFGAAPAHARMLARLSGGRIGWAIEASRDEDLLAQRRAQLQEWLEAPGQPTAARIELAGRLTAKDADVRGALELWLSWWRDLLLVKGGHAAAIVHADFADRLQHDAERLDLRAIERYLSSIQDARTQIEQNVNTRLAVEVMLLAIPASR